MINPEQTLNQRWLLAPASYPSLRFRCRWTLLLQIRALRDKSWLRIPGVLGLRLTCRSRAPHPQQQVTESPGKPRRSPHRKQIHRRTFRETRNLSLGGAQRNLSCGFFCFNCTTFILPPLLWLILCYLSLLFPYIAFYGNNGEFCLLGRRRLKLLRNA